MNVNEIKKYARERLNGKWKKVVLCVCMFILVEYIINKIFFSFEISEDFMDSPINNILVKVFNISQTTADRFNIKRKIINEIASNTISSEGLNVQLPLYINCISLISLVAKKIIELPLLCAFIISLMKFKRGEDIGILSFLENDNFQFKKAWKVELKRISVLIIPIILLFFISVSTVMDYNEMIRYSKYLDIPVGAYMFSEKVESCIRKFIIDILLLIVCSIYYYIQKLKYILSFEIAFDEPELSAKEVIEKSKVLMVGYRKQYFILELSFICWKILGYFTLGIGYLWIIPYIQISKICFYDKLRENMLKNSINNN